MKPTQNTPERWRPVVGYEGSYEVSNQGRVRSIDRVVLQRDGRRRRWQGRIRVVVPGNERGHMSLTLTDEHGKVVKKWVHRLVLESFVGPSPAGAECLHINGDCSDNRLENLRWDTHLENMRDIQRMGRHNNVNKTHCPRGHEYTADNTYLNQGRRNCRICKRESDRRYKARRKSRR